MFREMRRKNQLLSEAEAIEILKRCTAGVLGVTGDNGYPYTVPLSYVYNDKKLFFHVAREGHKIDGIQRNDKVTFCVIDQDEVIPEALTTHFRSVIVFGRAKILTDDAARRAALESLVEKYSPGHFEEGQRSIVREWERVCVVEVTIKHMTGKAAFEINKKKEMEQEATMTDEYQIVPIEKIDNSIWSAIGGGISDYNTQQAGDDQGKNLCFLLYSPEKEIVGGVIGATYWDWLYINLMWIQSELRGKGYGRQLLTLAEEEARQRGARHAFLDTFSFQAPGFYQKHGYRVFGTLPDFPAGHTRYFLIKDL